MNVSSLVSIPSDVFLLRKRRQLPTGEIPALCGLTASSGTDAGQQVLLEPPARVMSCSSYIPRAVMCSSDDWSNSLRPSMSSLCEAYSWIVNKGTPLCKKRSGRSRHVKEARLGRRRGA